MRYSNHQSAFTLVELAVVLVILGVLVTGIMAGSDLIRAAELRTITKEFQEYTSAAYKFRNKYQAIPGDFRDTAAAFPNATDMCDDTGAPASCGGNSNRSIDLSSGADSLNEPMLFWSQLAAADMISGRYTGKSGSGGAMHAIIGENIPKSELDNAGWSINRSEDTGGSIWVSTADNYGVYFGTHLVYGGQNNGGENKEPNLTPQELYSIDTKFDDGIANDGRVIAIHHSHTCADTDGAYHLSVEEISCSIRFRKLF